MTNEIARFGGLILFIYNYLEWIKKLKCVIIFGRFGKILGDQWKWLKEIIIFNGLCVILKENNFKPMGLLDLVVWICFFYYIEWIT
jgi:hypothetical protein